MDDANTRNPALAGYTKGVPMGGELEKPGAGQAPTFLVAALTDPLSGNLDGPHPDHQGLRAGDPDAAMDGL